MNFADLLARQKEFFQTGVTLSLAFRIAQLKKLRAAVIAHEEEIAEALKEDLGKSAFESYMCETGLALSEITYMLRHTKPDFMELMPGVIGKSIRRFSSFGTPVIAGGLIETKQELTEALGSGATAVSTGRKELWYL